MKKVLDILVLVVFGFVIIMHFLKIVYIVFKFSFLKKIPAISNKRLSDWQLTLYYLITIFALLGYLYNKFGLKSFG